ncbi:hypothetical protein Hanom_Chr16g01512021 [Helianthus anomalus]
MTEESNDRVFKIITDTCPLLLHIPNNRKRRRRRSKRKTKRPRRVNRYQIILSR